MRVPPLTVRRAARSGRDDPTESEKGVRSPNAFFECLCDPDHLECCHELGGKHRVRGGGPVHRCAHVLDLGPNDLEPRRHRLEARIEIRRAGDDEHTPCAARLELVQPFASLAECCECELADRLEHPVALAAVRRATPDQALVDEGCERVEIGVADVLGGLERATAAEHRETRKEFALRRGCEQVV